MEKPRRTYRPLNMPQPITVEAVQGRPIAIIDNQGTRTEVAAIEEFWVIDEEWWRERIRREYWRVLLVDGVVRTVYRDGESGRWYAQGY